MMNTYYYDKKDIDHIISEIGHTNFTIVPPEDIMNFCCECSEEDYIIEIKLRTGEIRKFSFNKCKCIPEKLFDEDEDDF